LKKNAGMKRLLKILFRSILILFLLLNVIVAFHAYKFTHFYNNGEIAVKKKEDKTGWDKAKEMFFGINAVKKQNDVTTDSTFKTVYLKTKDSLTLEAWYIAADSSKGTVLLFHGHGGNKSGVIKEAESFNKMGYHTLLVDFRAHGGSEGNTCTIGYNEAEDVKLAYDFIKNKGEKNMVLWGISMGASTITKAVKEYNLSPAKIILEMPFGTIKDAVAGRVKMMGLPPEPVSTLLTFWGGTGRGFWAFGMKPQEFVSSVKCPVLLQWGKNDPRVSRAEEETLFENIPNTNKKFVIYETAAHESLCKKEIVKWEAEVAAFLK
jgi:alpha-beta hydrolase superfamily lysophospholipase